MQTKTLVGSLSKYTLHRQHNKMNHSFTEGDFWSFDIRIKEFWLHTKQNILPFFSAFLCEEAEVLIPSGF